ncbi:acyl-CoA thioester hydrolase [Lutibacter oricola]|uniref:Acyl-CoA thioester hydrolase n=1 Tax=Lutibacter oricola TaxID=762486 RepID=A0A1H3CDN2_9FLAO|nr:thioesterase family protein [Lutibacter oricola]SDX52261.1 acyl-CoA thioester hydrolase [Lutibacter oricola]
MSTSTIQFRIRYSETDQMGYAHHGNYAQYFEMGRIEWLRERGVSYKQMEEDGIMLPVISLNTNYLKPAKYDDLLTLKTKLSKKPTARLEFEYEIYINDTLVTEANITLVFVNMKTNRPTRIPEYLLKKIEKHSSQLP